MQTLATRSSLAVAVDRLEVRAGRKRVLVSAFSWRHVAGSVAWLVGENGTGKSSLLRVLAGWQGASAGRVQWNHDLQRLRYYSPSMCVSGDLTVNDWIEFTSAVQGAVPPSDSIEQLKPRAANRRRRFSELSTGEAKRLLLWALLRRLEGPLVLDEPYEHLSREAKAALTVTLRTIARTSIVIVATNQDVALIAPEQLLTLDDTNVRVLQ
jgi:ATPase subunit of ABC transporter with duplicated ATPase domains